MHESPEIIDRITIVKVGTSTLVNQWDEGSEHLDTRAFSRIGEQVEELIEGGDRVGLVSSAFITAGMIEDGLDKRPNPETDMPELQRLAALGGRMMLNAWADAVPNRKTPLLLLTNQELNLAAERNEAINTLKSMFKHRDLPIINENDAISHEEIIFGDNDILASILAARLKSIATDVRLFLLTDKVGVCRNVNDPNTLIRRIDDPSAFENLAVPSDNPFSSGGMQSKLVVANIARKAGVDTWIAHGRYDNIIQKAASGKTGTYIPAAPAA